MPNWCSTRINIYGDKKKLKKFYNLLEKWTSRNYEDNGFGTSWLGNIVLGSEIGTVDTDPKTDIRCRGSLDYLDLYEDELTIDTETAWSPMLDMWYKLRDKYVPDAEIVWRAEECGCGLYDTNDPYYKGMYIIDPWDIDKIYTPDATEGTVTATLQRLLDTKEKDIDKLMKMFNESDLTEHMSINKWNYTDEY